MMDIEGFLHGLNCARNHLQSLNEIKQKHSQRQKTDRGFKLRKINQEIKHTEQRMATIEAALVFVDDFDIAYFTPFPPPPSI